MAILAAVGIAGAANASVVNFVSNPGLEQLGAFTGSMEWTYLGDNAGTLEITLTNTSPVGNGGYLTGLAFRAVYNDSLKIVYASDHENWLDDFFDESDGWGFAARFRGFEDGGSDKVNASLPAPGVLTALAMGAAGSRRRRR